MGSARRPPTELGDRWVAELDRHDVVARRADREHPRRRGLGRRGGRAPSDRFVGFFMHNPAAADAADAALERALDELAMRGVCLFPAMHGYRLDDERVARVFEAAARHGAAVFVHCGVLTVGVRKKLGLPSRFDLRLGDPLALARVAVALPAGAGDRPALRRRILPRGADGRRPVPEHPPRHVELQQLDQVPSGPDARSGLRQRARRRRAATAAVRHRLVVLPARLAAADLRAQNTALVTRSACRTESQAPSSAGTSSGCFTSRDSHGVTKTADTSLTGVRRRSVPWPPALYSRHRDPLVRSARGA